MTSFAWQLKTWRMAKGMTQRELTQKAKIYRSNLIGIEKGRHECTLKTLRQLACALGIRPGTLLDQAPEPTFVLSRHEIDELVRSLLGLQKPKSPLTSKIASLLTPLFYPIIRIVNSHTPKKSKRCSWLLKQKIHVLLGPKTLKQITARCNKLAANMI